MATFHSAWRLELAVFTRNESLFTPSWTSRDFSQTGPRCAPCVRILGGVMGYSSSINPWIDTMRTDLSNVRAILKHPS
jgi:hypothetical protein